MFEFVPQWDFQALHLVIKPLLTVFPFQILLLFTHLSVTMLIFKPPQTKYVKRSSPLSRKTLWCILNMVYAVMFHVPFVYEFKIHLKVKVYMGGLKTSIMWGVALDKNAHRISQVCAFLKDTKVQPGSINLRQLKFIIVNINESRVNLTVI